MGLLKRLVGGDKPGEPAESTAEQVKSEAAAPVHLTDEQFNEQVLGSEGAVLVDFWAEWCGPCHAIAPSVARLAEEYAGRLLVAKIDADEYPDILSRYGIMGIPTLIYFKGGHEVDRVVGMTPYGTLKNKVERLLA